MIEGFTRTHPMFRAVVLLGIIVIMRPEIISLFGFTVEGPANGTFV